MDKFLITLLSILIVSGSLALPASATERVIGRNGQTRVRQVVAEAKPVEVVSLPEKRNSLPVSNKVAKLISVRVETPVSNGTFTVNKDDASYSVFLTDTSKIFSRFWGNLDRGDIRVGDIVTVWGRWMDEDQKKIEVKWVRDVTRDRRYVNVVGTVLTNNDHDELSINTNKYGDVTVKTGEITKFYNRSWDQTKITDMKVGDEVQVRGVADIQDKLIGTTRAVRNLSR